MKTWPAIEENENNGIPKEFERIFDIPATYESFMKAYQKRKGKGVDLKNKLPSNRAATVYDALRIEKNDAKREKLTKILKKKGFFRIFYHDNF